MDKKPTYKDIFNLNLKYLDYLLAKSYFSHQYLKNIKLSGDQVESEFREIFSKLLPNRYKVTHGYIAFASSKDQEPILSPQIDMIIVDTLVPHSIIMMDDTGMELVPLESVVGIFEIKRTITPKIFKESLLHLYNIQSTLGIDKTNSQTYFPTGIKGLGVQYSNPIIGILSLDHERSKSLEGYGKKYGTVMDNLITQQKMPDLDIWGSLGHLIMATCQINNPKMLWAYTLREKNTKYQYLFKIKTKLTTDLTEAYFLSITIGFILYYISNITGRMTELENYFFNENI